MSINNICIMFSFKQTQESQYEAGGTYHKNKIQEGVCLIFLVVILQAFSLDKRRIEIFYLLFRFHQHHFQAR